MQVKNGEKISKIAAEAARIKRDFPELTFQQAIEKAKEVYDNAESKNSGQD